MLSFSLDRPRDVVDSAGVQSEPRKFARTHDLSSRTHDLCSRMHDLGSCRLPESVLCRMQVAMSQCFSPAWSESSSEGFARSVS